MYPIQHSHPMFILEELFCDLDDFCQTFEPQWRSQLISQGLKSRQRSCQMSLSEIMTILIAFHQSYYRNFKRYYLDHVCVYWLSEFPKLPSYQRFVEWMPSTLLPLCVYLKRCFGKCTGISFIDATSVKVPTLPEFNSGRNVALAFRESVTIGVLLVIKFLNK